MKLSELDLFEATIHDERELLRTQWQSPLEIRKWLKANGFKKIGGGVFADVFLKGGSKRVVKVSLRGDKCWIKFAQYFIRKTNNPHLPVVAWFKEYEGTYKGKRETFFVTIMEKLESYSPKILKKIKDPVVLAALLLKADLYANEVKSIRSKLADMGYDEDAEIKELLLDNHNHKFLMAMHEIAKAGGSGCYNDLHSGNFMWRAKTNTLVITDPLAGEYTA